MLGILLLVFALYSYFKPSIRHLSYLIYLSFMMGTGGGFGLTTDAILGLKNLDLAIVYTFVISTYLLINGKYNLPTGTSKKWFKAFAIFMVCSVIFSIVYYGFTVFQVLQGGRSILLIFSLPILIRITSRELILLFRWLLLITIITSILYIMQIALGRPLMPYSMEPHIDEATGLIRMYNAPPLRGFFLALSFVVPKYFGKRLTFVRVLLFIALICSLGRTIIFTTLLTILLCMIFIGKASKTIKVIFIIGLLMLPFIGIIGERFEKGGTNEDLEQILRGGYVNYERSGEATMTYRLAWVYERFAYLKDRPIGEQVFGLGLISESQPVVWRMYRFNVGNIVEETGLPNQLYTPDIAYGPILTRLGFVGGFIYLGFVVSIVVFLFKHRKQNALSIVCAAMGFMIFISSFSSVGLAEPKSFAMYFIIFSTLLGVESNLSNMKKNEKLLFKSINNNDK